jgi:hypothetical protein
VTIGGKILLKSFLGCSSVVGIGGCCCWEESIFREFGGSVVTFAV